MAAAGGGHNVTAEQWLHRPAAHIQQESSQANRIQDSKIRVTIRSKLFFARVRQSRHRLGLWLVERWRVSTNTKNAEITRARGSRLEKLGIAVRAVCAPISPI